MAITAFAGPGLSSKLCKYIIAGRYETHATIVTSNLDFSEWQDAFPNKLLGAATIDRLQHHAYQLILDGTSYRSVNKRKEVKTDT